MLGAVPTAVVHAVGAKPPCFALALASSGHAFSMFPAAGHSRAEFLIVVALQAGPATVAGAAPCHIAVLVAAAVRAAADSDARIAGASAQSRADRDSIGLRGS